MTDFPIAYWHDDTLYIYGSVLDNLFQTVGDIAFFLVLLSAELFALIGVLLWLVFIVRRG